MGKSKNNKVKFLLLIVIPFSYLLCSNYVVAQDYKSYPFWNPNLSLEKRVDDLVSRMTLEEKIGQIIKVTQFLFGQTNLNHRGSA